MIDALNNLGNLGAAGGAGGIAGASGSPGIGGSGGTGATSFSDILKKGIQDVSKLQQDASDAVDDVATGKTQDVTGVMTAVKKADEAFNMLVAIRSKLMDAYNEIKQISV